MPEQYDILFLQVDTATLGSSPQRVPLTFGDPVKSITGVQKALQAFLCLLLTKKGGTWNAAAGCDFLAVLEQGLIRTSVDAQNYFARDVPELLAQVNKNAVYSDEILTSAVLESAAVERSRLTLRIRLTTAAGTAVTFQAPI